MSYLQGREDLHCVIMVGMRNVEAKLKEKKRKKRKKKGAVMLLDIFARKYPKYFGFVTLIKIME